MLGIGPDPPFLVGSGHARLAHGSEMTCIVNGDRRRSEVDGKGLVVSCVYIFKGKQKHLERLINLIAKLTG